MYKALFKAFGPQRWWPAESAFEVAVGAILTQNTNWSNVSRAIANLKEARVLTPTRLFALGETATSRLIRPSGYYRLKTKRLRNFLAVVSGRYGNSLCRMKRVPLERLRQELLAITGIGPETADSILLYAFGKPVFVIDAYTKRIFSRHHLFPADVSYDDAQSYFMDRLPRDAGLFNEYHALIVRLGKEYCRKNGPRCKTCPLKNER